MAEAQEPVPDQNAENPTEEGQAQPSKSVELRTLEPGELERILEEHKKWLESEDYRKWVEAPPEEKSQYELE